MTPGLYVFLVVGIINITGLITDAVIIIYANISITHIAQTHHWLAYAILALQLIGVAGLGFHFLPVNRYFRL